MNIWTKEVLLPSLEDYKLPDWEPVAAEVIEKLEKFVSGMPIEILGKAKVGRDSGDIELWWTLGKSHHLVVYSSQDEPEVMMHHIKWDKDLNKWPIDLHAPANTESVIEILSLF